MLFQARPIETELVAARDGEKTAAGLFGSIDILHGQQVPRRLGEIDRSQIVEDRDTGIGLNDVNYPGKKRAADLMGEATGRFLIAAIRQDGLIAERQELHKG